MAPPSAQRRPASVRPGMSISTPRLVALVAGVLVAVMVLAVGLTEAFTHAETKTTTVARDIERIVVEADAGDVRLEAATAHDVVIIEQRRWLGRGPTVVAQVRGGVLEIHGSCPEPRLIERCEADLTLRVPFDADVQVRSDAGDLTAMGVAGHVQLATRAGDVLGRDLHPVSATAAAGAGDIDLDFATMPVSVNATAQVGDIAITVPPGDYKVDTRADAGEDEVENVLRDDRSLRSILAQSGAGDIMIRGRGARTMGGDGA
jgi:putative adhesin